MSEGNEIFIDGTDLVLGRLSSWLAKRLLSGEKVTVVNAQDMIVSGKKRFLVESHLQKRERATHTNPNRGPFYPRYPDRILRRTVRGMLPWKTSAGKQAFRRLSAYIDIPEKLQDKAFISISEAKRTINNSYMTVGDLSKAIGWVPRSSNQGD
ncbi:MAG: 50S ribosomal protein L13 [Candidatus Kariarchaeaceae archaeon]